MFHQRQKGSYCRCHAINNMIGQEFISLSEFNKYCDEFDRKNHFSPGSSRNGHMFYNNGLTDNIFGYILEKKGIKIIKSYLIRTQEDFKSIKMEKESADYFLFDYKSDNHGGSGKSFDWKILNNKLYDKPFFLSGGLSLDNMNNIKTIDDNKMLYGLDLNSKFEISPGLKDVKKISKLFNLNL